MSPVAMRMPLVKVLCDPNSAAVGDDCDVEDTHGPFAEAGENLFGVAPRFRLVPRTKMIS